MANAANNPILTVLHETEISTILDKDRKVYSLSSKASVEDAVKLLSEKKIQSAPIVDGKESRGMVDMLDIAGYVVSVAPTDRELEKDELSSLEIAGRAIALVPLSRVADFSGRDPLVPVFVKSPLSQVTEIFSKAIHHAVVFSDDQETIENIVTGSDVVKFLKAHIHMGESKAIAQKTAKELGLGQIKPVRINKDKTVLDALRKMNEAKVSSLAVCDGGKLVGNFSASDLVGLYQGHFPKFLSTLEDFLKENSPKSLVVKCTTLDATLQDIVSELAESHLHHLWILDEEFGPGGIVSITDICRVIHNYNYE